MRVESEQRPSMGSETKRPVTNHAASALASSAHIPNGIDWQAFSTVYFPGRGRHDLEAVTAYGAYRRSHAADARSSHARASEERARIEAEPRPAGPTALQDWEDEGGAASRGRGERLSVGHAGAIPARTVRPIPGVRSPRLAGAH